MTEEAEEEEAMVKEGEGVGDGCEGKWVKKVLETNL
jgi:hypothetical protein